MHVVVEWTRPFGTASHEKHDRIHVVVEWTRPFGTANFVIDTSGSEDRHNSGILLSNVSTLT